MLAGSSPATHDDVDAPDANPLAMEMCGSQYVTRPSVIEALPHLPDTVSVAPAPAESLAPPELPTGLKPAHGAGAAVVAPSRSHTDAQPDLRAAGDAPSTPVPVAKGGSRCWKAATIALLAITVGLAIALGASLRVDDVSGPMCSRWAGHATANSGTASSSLVIRSPNAPASTAVNIGEMFLGNPGMIRDVEVRGRH